MYPGLTVGLSSPPLPYTTHHSFSSFCDKREVDGVAKPIKRSRHKSNSREEGKKGTLVPWPTSRTQKVEVYTFSQVMWRMCK